MKYLGKEIEILFDLSAIEVRSVKRAPTPAIRGWGGFLFVMNFHSGWK